MILIIAGYLSGMIRPAYLAGQWYPDTESGCREAVESHAAEAQPEQGSWGALVAPHAGWMFSGDVAARGFAWLAAGNSDIDLVVVFGSHRGPQGPNTLFRGEAWETPLGPLTTAQDLVVTLGKELDLSDEPVEPRRPDNAVEVLLPFVRHFFPRAELLMLGVEASARAATIGRTVGETALAAGRKAAYVGSTDLTHYGPNYGFEPHGPGSHAQQWVRTQNDRGFIDALLTRDVEGAVAHARAKSSACCPGAAVAALSAAESTSKPHLIEHKLSCDVRPSSSFVGYAGIVL